MPWGLELRRTIKRPCTGGGEAIRDGNAEAMYHYGNAYAEGLGVRPDLGEARNWWDSSAEKGCADAQFALGRLYFSDSKIGRRNVSLSAKWLEKAAEQGHAEAKYYLGLLYEKGEGVSQNSEKAVKLFRDAAEKASQARCTILDWHILRGMG